MRIRRTEKLGAGVGAGVSLGTLAELVQELVYEWAQETPKWVGSAARTACLVCPRPKA